jgi:hypothetical protein
MLPQFLRPRRWISIPRAQAHRLVLAMPPLADRQLQAAMYLQIQRLHGRAAVGYCWRRLGDAQVEAWYWDESTPDIPASELNGRQPCPEHLLRAEAPDGFSLTRCSAGVDAAFCRGGRLEKARWFSAVPSDADWAWFVQDAGASPVEVPIPRVREAPARHNPPKEWSFFTSLHKPVTRLALAGFAAATLAGGALAAAAVYDFKLSGELERVRGQRALLATEAASAVKLQAELDDIATKVSGLSAQQAPVLQLQAMARLANSGLVGDASKVFLLEWEFRNDRMRMLFSVPPDKFVLSEFLAGVEKIGAFAGVKLLPGTPPQTVGLQASLRPVTAIAQLVPVVDPSVPAATSTTASLAVPQGKR